MEYFFGLTWSGIRSSLGKDLTPIYTDVTDLFGRQ
jgi:hypothetical protein